jgi:hypothetical protein
VSVTFPSSGIRSGASCCRLFSVRPQFVGDLGNANFSKFVQADTWFATTRCCLGSTRWRRNLAAPCSSRTPVDRRRRQAARRLRLAIAAIVRRRRNHDIWPWVICRRLRRLQPPPRENGPYSLQGRPSPCVLAARSPALGLRQFAASPCRGCNDNLIWAMCREGNAAGIWGRVPFPLGGEQPMLRHDRIDLRARATPWGPCRAAVSDKADRNCRTPNLAQDMHRRADRAGGGSARCGDRRDFRVATP